jgi:hypothetical protein
MLTAKLARSFLGVLGVALLASACTTAGPRPEPEAPADPSTLLTLTVRNDQMDEARVWLYVDNVRYVLGTVRGVTEKVFYQPLPQISRVRMEFDLTLGEHCVTPEYTLGPGDDISTTIPINLNMMVAVCRRR